MRAQTIRACLAARATRSSPRCASIACRANTWWQRTRATRSRGAKTSSASWRAQRAFWSKTCAEAALSRAHSPRVRGDASCGDLEERELGDEAGRLGAAGVEPARDAERSVVLEQVGHAELLPGLAVCRGVDDVVGGFAADAQPHRVA